MSFQSLGIVLVEIGVITEAQFAEAWAAADGNESQLAEALVNLGYATEAQIVKGIGLKHNAPYFESLEGIIAPDAGKLLPEKIARRCQVAPLLLDEDKLMIAMLNPFDVPTIDMLTQQTGRAISPVVSTRRAIFNAINAIYVGAAPAGGGAPSRPEAAHEATVASSTAEFPELPEDFSWVSHAGLLGAEGEEAPVIRLVDALLREGIRLKAADLHIVPDPEDIGIFFRIDGFLQEFLRLPIHLLLPLTSRIKILARLDIAESRLPQDGHIQMKYRDRSIDLRVSTLPTVTGEKTVIRILDKAGLVLDLDTLGFPDAIRSAVDALLAVPNGILLVTGPTGSGKTTTLYTMLAGMRGRKLNITTLEDPVEYQLEGISQVSVKANIGFTFSRGLRALLRQDPDILLVGEIRDNETASIAINAALTGHFILSTLHTNDAPSAVARLLNMEIEPYLITSSVRGVIAQRLLRKLCVFCREPYQPGPELLARLDLSPTASYQFFAARGCPECLQSGYKGRIGVYEMIVMNDEIAEAILKRAPTHQILAKARQSGFRDMLELGAEKVVEGLTSAEELVRVTKGL